MFGALTLARAPSMWYNMVCLCTYYTFDCKQEYRLQMTFISFCISFRFFFAGSNNGHTRDNLIHLPIVCDQPMFI